MKVLLNIVKFALPLVLALVLFQVATVADTSAAPEAQGGTYYVVRAGDTLSHIGRMFGVHPFHIAEVNGIYDPDHIYAGEVLYIPSGGGHGCGNPCYGGGYHDSSYYYGGCGYSDCNSGGYYDSKYYYDDCGYSDCHSGGYYDSKYYYDDCGYSDCNSYDSSYYYYPRYGHGYGYDYSGYYYNGHYPSYNRYSYTCGYYYNCY